MGNGISVRKLFKGLNVQVRGNKDLELTGICAHSKFVSPGNLFIAKKGAEFDAAEFIPDAVASGASAVLTDLYNPFLKGSTQVIHPRPACIEPEIANRFFQHPSKELFLIGITGTNGKTTTAYLIHHLLDAKDTPCGLMGTIENCVGKVRIPSHLTTNDIVTNQKYFREMRDQGSVHAVMEVTSHALDQGRVAGCDFDLGIFTNLSQDHLDYHGSMDSYLNAKARLFKMIDTPKKLAILNVDDPVAFQVLGKSQVQVVTYGIKQAADFKAMRITSSLGGTYFTLVYRKKEIRIETVLMGNFNVLNVLAAIAASFYRGLSIEEIRSKLVTFPGVPGRLERIANNKGIHLFVDFAHTEQALAQVLSVLEQVKERRIITIFGCGGDRDQSKRSKMGTAAEKFSDHIIITSDNPRTEEPYEICKDIASGIKKKKNMLIEVDRRKAIAQGIALAKEGDVVLVAGRGHEPFQKIRGRFIPFDDRKVVREICNHSF